MKRDPVFSDPQIAFFEEFESEPIITSKRIDIAIKLHFLANPRSKWAQDLYERHIGAVTGFTFKENGSKKNGIDDFIKSFISLNKSIAIQGFTKDAHPIPLSEAGTPMNGAHRIAASIYNGKTARWISSDGPELVYDIPFFERSGVSASDIEVALLTYVEAKKNLRLALVWPASKSKDVGEDAFFPNILHTKSVDLSLIGQNNLITECYMNEPWIGKPTSGYPGSERKRYSCFQSGTIVKLVWFHEDSLQNTQRIKSQIRELFGVGNHSIHIPDTHEEVVQLSQLLLNPAGLAFLQNAKHNSYPEIWQKMSTIKTELNDARISQNEYAIDTGMVMELFGLRKATDIDLVFTSSTPLQKRKFDHTKQVVDHFDVEVALDNPTSTFNFRGLNWMSIDMVRALKLSRSEQKDLHDIRLINRRFGTHRKTLGSKIRNFLHLLWFNAYKYKTRAFVITLKLLEITHLYQPIRRIYRALKNKK